MSWMNVEPRKSGASTLMKRMVCMSKASGRICLTVRTGLMDGMEWLTTGAMVKVQLGGGDHAGLLRVSPNGLHLVKKVGRAGASRTAMLVVPDLPGMKAGIFKPMPVEFDHGLEWLEVTLPSWALPAPAIPAAAAPTAPAGVTRPPPVALVDRVAGARAGGGPIKW